MIRAHRLPRAVAFRPSLPERTANEGEPVPGRSVPKVDRGWAPGTTRRTTVSLRRVGVSQSPRVALLQFPHRYASTPSVSLSILNRCSHSL